MQYTAVMGLSLFSTRRRAQTPAYDLDVALAGAQAGLEKKRQRWLLFLIEKEERCKSQLTQAAELDGYEEPSGIHVRSANTEVRNSNGS